MTLKSLIGNGLIIAATCLAFWLLYRILQNYSLDDIRNSLLSIPLRRLCFALLCAAASYLCLTGFDFLALLSLGKSLPYRKIALASFVSLSMGHNIGFAGLSSGAFRYRFYSRWGLSIEEVAKIVLFCGITVGLGMTALGGTALLVDPADAAGLLSSNTRDVRTAGVIILAVPVLYAFLTMVLRQRMTLWRWSFELPGPHIALLQIVIGALNFVCVSACLHQLLSAFADVALFRSITAYVLANTAVMATHVPGGLGVIETTVSYIVPNAASIGALIAFRCIYFLIPLILGTTLLIVSELASRHRSARTKDPAKAADKTTGTQAPQRTGGIE
ncbi:lysylphosphatidylglycerol synthase domain-containing protein [Rhizobium sp. BR 362]|uniref:lysylphosphatidylglycerol synthase domain-containing protein n=1 Tax=Rhizobium sp. BR 362 TaxID=3040670 RepID=UPI002F3E5286